MRGRGASLPEGALAPFLAYANAATHCYSYCNASPQPARAYFTRRAVHVQGLGACLLPARSSRRWRRRCPKVPCRSRCRVGAARGRRGPWPSWPSRRRDASRPLRPARPAACAAARPGRVAVGPRSHWSLHYRPGLYDSSIDIGPRAGERTQHATRETRAAQCPLTVERSVVSLL